MTSIISVNGYGRFYVTLEQDEDKVWVVQCPSIPGCVSQGKTKAAAIRNIKDAIGGCIEAIRDSGEDPGARTIDLSSIDLESFIDAIAETASVGKNPPSVQQARRVVSKAIGVLQDLKVNLHSR